MKTNLALFFVVLAMMQTACSPAGKALPGVSNLSSHANLQGGGGETSEGIPTPSRAAPVTSQPVHPGQFIAPFPLDSRTYSAPWKRPDTQIIIDAYSGNGIDWDKMATDKRVTAVIHRSTSGMTLDTAYKAREKMAKVRGYLWGAYHLGQAGNPIAQAKLFLNTIGDTANTMMFLDLEDTSNPKMMNISNAKIFLNYVFQQTGKIPVIYANGGVTLALTAAMKSDPTFTKTRLWYARFKSSITDFKSSNLLWPNYFLWQFSSEINCTKSGNCLYNVPGTSADMDVNVFYGSRAALAYEWSI